MRFRILLCVSLSACAASTHSADPGYPTTDVSGVVVDAAARPIAGAEVAICDCDNVGCTALRRGMYLSPAPPSTIAEMLRDRHRAVGPGTVQVSAADGEIGWVPGTVPDDWQARTEAERMSGFGTLQIVRTDHQGRWRTSAALCGRQAHAFVWAPQMVPAKVPYDHLVAGAPRTVLRPSGTLRVHLPCAHGSCSDGAIVANAPTGSPEVPFSDFSFPNMHAPEGVLTLYGLSAGEHDVQVFRGIDAPGEEQGRARVAVEAGPATALPMTMERTGLGAALAGRLRLVTGEGELVSPVFWKWSVRVEAHCGTKPGRGDSTGPVIRRATVDVANGNQFQIADIGPAPCSLHFVGDDGTNTFALCEALDASEEGAPGVFVRSRDRCPLPPPEIHPHP